MHAALDKARYWARHAGAGFDQNQRKMVNRLLDAGPRGFEGDLTTAKYVSLTRVSRATAFRDLAALVAAGALGTAGVGKATRYFINLHQDKVWRVGWLVNIRRPDSESHFIYAFSRGMRELGYVEGRNVVYERRFTDGKSELLAGMAAGLAQLKVDLIVAGSAPAIAAAQKATSTIPIVILADSDPVGNGFVASLARPEGNITGLSSLGGGAQRQAP